ncbi:MAG: hypothetical protein HYX83_03710 [Chloroflexi bacterium]|nr:hypothetical protein [Chloroflexota bacterium]
MVKRIEKNGKVLYLCELCGFAYTEKEWATRLHEWCSSHHSCNLEIIEHGVP